MKGSISSKVSYQNLNPEDLKSQEKLATYISDLKKIAMTKKPRQKRKQSQATLHNQAISNQSSQVSMVPTPVLENLKKQLFKGRESFHMVNESDPEVALKKYMVGVRQSEQQQIKPKKNNRSQSTKSLRSASCIKLDKASIQKKLESEITKKFKRYLKELQSFESPQQMKNKSVIGRSSIASCRTSEQNITQAKTRVGSNSSKKQRRPSKTFNSSSSNIIKNSSQEQIITMLKNNLKNLRGQAKQQSQQSQDMSKFVPSVASSAKAARNRSRGQGNLSINKTTKASYLEPNRQEKIRSFKEQGVNTQSTDMTENKMIYSIDPKKFHSNYTNSNTYTTNTLFSLQYLQKQTSSLTGGCGQQFNSNYITDTFNRGDITSIQNQGEQDIEDLHCAIVRKMQKTKKILEEKEGTDVASFGKETPEQRQKNKTRCSNRSKQQQSNVILLTGDEIIVCNEQ